MVPTMYQTLFFMLGIQLLKITQQHIEISVRDREESRSDSKFLCLSNSKNVTVIYQEGKDHGRNRLGKIDQEFISGNIKWEISICDFYQKSGKENWSQETLVQERDHHCKSI